MIYSPPPPDAAAGGAKRGAETAFTQTKRFARGETVAHPEGGFFCKSRLYPLFWVRGSFKKAQIAVIPIIALVGFWREATRRGLALRAKRSRTWQARSGTSPPQLARSGLDGGRDGVHRSWQRGSAALFRWLEDLA